MTKPIDDMTTQEALVHLQDLRQKLLRKQAREKAYLDRRAVRGTHAPTDDAYEADQELENDLLALIDNIEKGLYSEVTHEL